jgi:pyrroline-5-carboxylate reductase
MGGAIARGLANGHYIQAQEISVSNPSAGKLNALKAEFPAIHVTHSNKEAAEDADIIIIAVKPWKVEEVLKPLRLRGPQILVSVAAGLTFEDLAHFVDPEMPMFRVIPNTAISEGASMTLIAAQYNAYLWVVAGTTLGMMIANAPVVWLGDKITRKVPIRAVHLISAVIFLVLGLLAIFAPAT